MTPAGGQTPTFSVIVPVFEDAAGLRVCLDALARQTVPCSSFEVIVVDNGSSAPPDAVVADYAFARLLHEPSPGSYAARNAGCAAAAGRYLAFADADCQPRPGWLSQALAHFEHHPETVAIGGAIHLTPSPHPTAAELYDCTLSFRQDRFVVLGGFAATANLIVRHDVFCRVGPFDAKLKSTGDREWGQRLTAAGLALDFVATAAVDHPPRQKLTELVAKRRRLEAGFRAVPSQPRPAARERIPSLRGRLSGLAMADTLLRRPARLELRRIDGLKVLLVAVLMVLVGLGERVRLAWGGVAHR